jgi:hypothetical protein
MCHNSPPIDSIVKFGTACPRFTINVKELDVSPGQDNTPRSTGKQCGRSHRPAQNLCFSKRARLPFPAKTLGGCLWLFNKKTSMQTTAGLSVTCPYRQILCACAQNPCADAAFLLSWLYSRANCDGPVAAQQKRQGQRCRQQLL